MKKQNRTLMVLKYLWENTDDRHPATVADITAYLSEQGISVKDYRVIQNDIASLADFGIDIVAMRKQRYEYFVRTRHFDTAEVKLLVDAVQSSRFISNKQSKVLIQRLSAFVGPQNANIIKRHLYFDQQFKATNESVLDSVDAIYSAIVAKTKVTFQYFDYSPEKKKVARHGGRFYVVSPYSMLWSNDKYYMVGYSEDKGLVQKFRIDRIDNLSVVEEPRVKPPKDYRVSNFFTREFSMLSGQEAKVELLVENSLMNSIIDHFGERVRTEIVDADHFKATVTVSLNNVFYGWVFASQGKMRLLGPQSAIDGFHYIIEQYEKAR